MKEFDQFGDDIVSFMMKEGRVKAALCTAVVIAIDMPGIPQNSETITFRVGMVGFLLDIVDEMGRDDPMASVLKNRAEATIQSITELTGVDVASFIINMRAERAKARKDMSERIAQADDILSGIDFNAE
jgi:hypothetical protein